MKHKSPFVISEFTNPSGAIVFQLYARLDGTRFRKNFLTREEAEPERQVQEVQLRSVSLWMRAARKTRRAETGRHRLGCVSESAPVNDRSTLSNAGRRVVNAPGSRTSAGIEA